MTTDDKLWSLDQLFTFVAQQYANKPHNHQWAILEVHDISQADIHPRLVQNPRTLVLLKCHCGLPMTLTLEGQWTMSQLQQQIGERHATQGQTGNAPTAKPETDNEPSGEYPIG